MHVSRAVFGTLGAADLAVNCSKTVCYATTPSAEQYLQWLQSHLNQYAALVGSKKLTPDYAGGKLVALIGPATVALAQKVATYLSKQGLVTSITWAQLSTIAKTKESLARGAHTFLELMGQATVALANEGIIAPHTPPPATAPVSTTIAPTITPPMTSTVFPTTSAGLSIERKWWWIGGSILAAGAAATIFILTRPSPSPSV
jgi:hypothetical protein